MILRTVLALAVLVCGIAATTPARAQETPPPTPTGRPAAQPQQSVAVVALDRPISRTAYRLGPGDVLGIALFGELSEQFNVTVTPEGTVVIPTIGFTSVLGLNIDQAEARVRALVGRLYRGLEVRVTLAAVRSFKVFVAGNVENRGVRIATSVTRVSEVMPRLNASETLARSVVLRHADGDSVVLDLVRFQQTGDLRDNPTLREGDVIMVPVVTSRVRVVGSVNFPGTYEFRRGESVADFLAVANAGADFPSSAADTIRISRFTDAGEREMVTLTQAEALGPRGRALLLRPFDLIFVSEVANFRSQHVATISGEVRFPGSYPVRPDTTTLRELVEMAGGFTPNASLADATLVRRIAGGSGRPSDLDATPDSALSREEREARSIAAQVAGQAFVLVDFRQLFVPGAAANDQLLRAGDVAVVPQRRREVTVAGAVLTPGILAYRHGATVEDYVRLAGGFAQQADRGEVSVIKSGRGNRVGPRDAWYPEEGDQIVVPFRARRTFTERLQAVSAVAASITSAVLTVVALTRL